MDGEENREGAGSRQKWLLKNEDEGVEGMKMERKGSLSHCQ